MSSDVTTIYMIMRVYNVGNGNINFNVHVDSYNLWQEKLLEITLDSYKVQPKNIA